MARHLLIGNSGVASLVNAASETDLAVNIQKLSADGPVNMVAGDTVADSDSFRVVQGTAGNNIVSPWIKGRNVVNWSGVSGAAAVAHSARVRAVTQATATGEIVIKIVRKGGTYPEFFTFTATPTLAASTIAQTAVVIESAFNALTGVPDWLNPIAADDSTDDCVITGALRGDVAQSGNVWEEGPAIFDIIIESNGMTAQVISAVNGDSAAYPGVGDGNLLRKLEGDLQGISAGYYNRIQLPNAPALAAVAATNYDIWNIVATKDGSTSSSINGVDNLIEIMVANTSGSAANALAFENAMNAYCASAGFGNVIL